MPKIKLLLFTKGIDPQIKDDFKKVYIEWLRAENEQTEAPHMAKIKKIAEESGIEVDKLKPKKLDFEMTEQQRKKHKDFQKFFNKGTGVTINEQMKKGSNFIAVATA